MAKQLDVTVVLKDFEGNALKDKDYDAQGNLVSETELTLKAVLVNYLQHANLMGISSDSEKLSAYLAGLAIGTGGANTQLEQSQYDVLKKIVDNNKVKNAGAETELYKLVVQYQVKQMLDNAQTVTKESN